MDLKEAKGIVKRHVFGVQRHLSQCLSWMDEGTLLYPAGKGVVLHNLSNNGQRFLDAQYTSQGVTCIAVSANKKFIAIAEGGSAASGDMPPQPPQVQIIDTVTRKRRKVLTIADMDSPHFVAMAFSADGRHIVTQGGAPSWNLYYWNWERSKPLAVLSMVTGLGPQETTGARAAAGVGAAAVPDASAAVAAAARRAGASVVSASSGPVVCPLTTAPPPFVTAVGICPSDPLMVTVSGIGMLRFCRYTDGVLQPQASCGYPREQTEVFQTHAWINGDQVVASTRQAGELILLERGRYVGALTMPTPAMAGEHSMYAMAMGDAQTVVTSICPTQHGFISGTDDGSVCVYERYEDATTSMGAKAVIATEDAGGLHLVCTMHVPTRDVGQQFDIIPTGDEEKGANQTDVVGNAQGSRVGGAAGAASVGGGVGAHEGPFIAGTGSADSQDARARRIQLGASPQRTWAGGVSGGAAQRESCEEGGAGSAEGKTTGSFSQPAATLDGDRASASAMVPSAMARLHGVYSLALNQSEEALALTTAMGKIYALNVKQDWARVDAALRRVQENADRASPLRLDRSGADGSGAASGAFASNMTLASTKITTMRAEDAIIPSFEPVCQPLHSGRLNGMDCAVRKPFLITTGSDHSIRVWNTATNTLIISEFFQTEPKAVAMHPNGLMAVVCFTDKVRVLSVLWNSLRERKVINFRNASDVRFSKGGQYFVVVHGNLVDMYNATTCELHGQLRGHPQRIKDLQWTSSSLYPLDDRIVTCSADGMLIDWNTIELRKGQEHTDKRYQYVAVASDDRNIWSVAAPTSATAIDAHWKVKLREVDRHNLAAAGGAQSIMTEDYEFSECTLNSLCVAPHQRMLFAGTTDGSVKVMTFPLQAGVQEPPLTAHSGPIVKMVLSFDERTLFTASADGTFISWDVRVDGMAPRADKQSALLPNEEVLVTQQETDDMRLEVESLQQQLEKLRTDLDSEEKRRSHEQGTRVRERAEEFRSDAATLRAEYGALWNSKSEQERSFVAVKLEKEAEAAQALEELERGRQQEVQTLEDECGALQHTLDDETIHHSDALLELEKKLTSEAHEQDEHFDDVKAQREEGLRKLERQVQRSEQTNTEMLRQLEMDTDTESHAVVEKHSGEFKTLRDRFLHMKGEGAIMRKNAARMEKEIEVRAGEIQLLDSAKAALGAQLTELSQRMNQLHQDIDERDEVIGEREKRIYALKKQNQELEKHKFVLDHRIRQLKAQMEPKQRQIAQLAERTKHKNTELQDLHESNLTLRSNIDELKADLQQQQDQIKHMNRKLKDCETYRKRAERDLTDLAPCLQEPARLREVVDSLYSTHVTAKNGVRIAQADPTTKEEFNAQLGYLSTSIDALRRKVKLDQERHKQEVSDMMTNNLALIREIHDLREEIARLRTHVAAEEATRRNQASKQKKKGALANRGGASSLNMTFSETNATSVSRFSDTNASSAAAGSRAGGASRRFGPGAAAAAGFGAQPPEPPREIEENRSSLRMQRAYIDSIERALAKAAEAPRPGSSMRLPPLNR